MKSEFPFKQKLNQAKNIVKKLGKVVIAFSGGVDSSLLLKLSLEVLGKENVLAVIASSPTFPKEELKEAVNLAKNMDAPFLIIETSELKNPEFRKNPPDRCYYCKRELFSSLQKIAAEKGFKKILDGSNADDLKDFRPGRKAAREFSVGSPLAEAGLRKKEIRELAKLLGLPNHQKPAFACLASRFPYHQPLSLKELKKVAKAESYLRSLGFSQLRVRHHQETARIEVEEEEILRFLRDSGLRKKVSAYFKKLGFTFVALDLEGYQGGSLNKLLKNSSRNTG